MSTPAVKYKSADEITLYIESHPLKETGNQLNLKSLWQDLADSFSNIDVMSRDEVTASVKGIIKTIINDENGGTQEQKNYIEKGPSEFIKTGVGPQFELHQSFIATYTSCTRIMLDCAENRKYSASTMGLVPLPPKRVSITKQSTT